MKIEHPIQRDSGNLGGRVPSPLLVDFGRFWSILVDFETQKWRQNFIAQFCSNKTRRWNSVSTFMKFEGNWWKRRVFNEECCLWSLLQLSIGQNLMKIAGNVEFFWGEVVSSRSYQLFISCKVEKTCSRMKKWKNKTIKMKKKESNSM